MADTKFSALSAVVTPATTDQLVVLQGGTAKTETIAQVGTALCVRKRASGTSTSNIAGTVVAQVTATAGKKLMAWDAIAAQTATANTQVRITVTYSDATTTSETSASNTAATIIGNHGGLLRTVGGAHVQLTAVSDKDVTDITITTQATGTGTRSGAISAIEVPQ